MSFYVYALLDPRTNKPVYVGKGIGSRAWYHNKAGVNHPNNKLQTIYNQLRNSETIQLTVKDEILLVELLTLDEPINFRKLIPEHKIALLPVANSRLIRFKIVSLTYDPDTYSPLMVTIDKDKVLEYRNSNLIVKILANELTEEDALDHEKEWIDYYSDFTLTNSNNGGGGRQTKT